MQINSVKVGVAKSCPSLCDPRDCPCNSLGQNTGVEGLGHPLQCSCFSLPGGCPGGSAGKESASNAGDLGSVPGLGRSPGEGKGYLLQDSGLQNPIDCIVRGGRKESDTTERLSLFHPPL